MKHKFLAIAAAIVVTLAWACPALADGIIIPEPPPWPEPPYGRHYGETFGQHGRES